jgi:hypothetical protein
MLIEGKVGHRILESRCELQTHEGQGLIDRRKRVKQDGDQIIIVTDLINASPGNSSANTNADNNSGESVARKRNFKHPSTTMGDGVF